MFSTCHFEGTLLQNLPLSFHLILSRSWEKLNSGLQNLSELYFTAVKRGCNHLKDGSEYTEFCIVNLYFYPVKKSVLRVTPEPLRMYLVSSSSQNQTGSRLSTILLGSNR